MKVHRHLWSRILQLILLLSLACPGMASAVGHPYLVKNINPYFDSIDATIVRSSAPLGTSLIFSANDGTTGQELWKTDGTEAGTQLVANIRPGLSWSSPANMTTVDSKVFFTANDGTNGTELWVTDGTAGGTQLLKDIYQGSSGPAPANLVAFNGRLFFTAASVEYGTELWTSDGTPAGTVLFRDFNAGTGSSTFGSLEVINGSLLISVYRGSSWELWKSDGTSEGTQLVRSGFNAQPEYFTSCNGTIFFRGSVTGSGPELWQTDGSDSGTLPVKEIYAGSSGSYPAALTCVATTLFFAATDPAAGTELWKSDGTEAGTVLVRDIHSGPAGSAPEYLTALNGTLLFSAYTPETGRELWQSDGTPDGTTLLADLNPGTGYSSPALRLVAEGRLFFSANTSLWVTDGTPAGTFQLSDTTSTATITRAGTTVYFSAYEGATGRELRAVSLDNAPFTRITAPQSGTAVSGAQVTIGGEAHGDAGAAVTLTEVSTDGGATWNPATGTTVWSYEWSPAGDGTYTVMARSTDSNALVETAPAVATVTIDTLPPTVSLAINGNASFTPYRTVTLSLTASATEAGLDCSGQAVCGTLSARFSNDGATWGGWLTASASTQWDLGTGNGPRTVYAEVRDRAGNIAQTSAAITLDTTVVPELNIALPLDSSVLTSVYPSLSVTVSGWAADHSGTGLNRVEIALDSTTNWSAVASGTTTWSHTLTNLTNGVYTVYVRAIDNAGYISPVSRRQFLVDVSPITGAVVINGGAASTGSSQVTLTLYSVDPWAPGICPLVFPPPFGCEPKALTMRFSTDNVTWSGSYPYATTMPWNLGSSNTIYVRYTNQYGVSSPVYSDSIILTTSPASTILQPTANSFTRQGTVTVSGTASPSAGNSITLVEVSTNNGATWQAAAGTGSWSYSWTPPTDGVYYLKSRATDSVGTVETPAGAVSVTVDRTLPTGSIVYDYNNDLYRLNASANDPGVICVQVYPNLCGSLEMLFSGSSTWQAATATLPYGTASLQLRDRAGNTTFISQVAQYGFPVRLEQTGTPLYSTIQEASGSAVSGTTMKLTMTNFAETLVFGRGIALTLQGGFNNTFSTVSGASAVIGAITVQGDDLEMRDITLHGAITVQGGSLSCTNLVIQD